MLPHLIVWFFCLSIGGNLAEIRNGFENAFVAGFVSNSTDGLSSYPYWVGANLLMASRWTWTTNDKALYTNWAADQPLDPSIFQCGSVRAEIYLWSKELCSSARPFVCTVNVIADPGTDPATECEWYDLTNPAYTNFEPGYPSGPYPIKMLASNGRWNSEIDFRPRASAVICEKQARNV